MSRIRKFVGWVWGLLFTLVAMPLVVDYWEKANPTAADYETKIGTVWVYVVAFANLSWVFPLALFLGGVIVGKSLDWLLSKFDGSRERKKREIGREFLWLAQRIRDQQNGFHGDWPDNISHLMPEIGSALIDAKKIGIAPIEQNAFYHPNGPGQALGYLGLVGQFLCDGHFREAASAAKSFQ